jgi:hypothetical protein
MVSCQVMCGALLVLAAVSEAYRTAHMRRWALLSTTKRSQASGAIAHVTIPTVNHQHSRKVYTDYIRPLCKSLGTDNPVEVLNFGEVDQASTTRKPTPVDDAKLVTISSPRNKPITHCFSV